MKFLPRGASKYPYGSATRPHLAPFVGQTPDLPGKG